jgi:hypothetical protein
MELAFPWPISQGEWLAWSSAAVTLALGLLMLFAPRTVLRLLRLQTVPEHAEAVAEVRATMAGFHIGVGLAAILLAQPLIYLTLGICWALTAFGRLISILSDRGGTVVNWLWLVVEMALAALALGFALGMVP